MKKQKKQTKKAAHNQTRTAKKPAPTSAAASTPAPRKAPPQEESPSVPHAKSKKEIVITLLSRDGGATLDEIMSATSWQKHSVRGFISTIKKKLSYTVVRNGNSYQISKAA